MKKITIRLCRNARVMLVFLLLIISSVESLKAQPTWGTPPTATINDKRLFTQSNGTKVIGSLSSDMYTDVSLSGSFIGDYVIAVVWEEQVSIGTWEVRLGIYDNASNSLVYRDELVASDARHPDICIGDVNPSFPGRLYFNIVYEDEGNLDAMFVVYAIDDLLGYGTPSVLTVSTPAIIDATSGNDARNPRIDALPRDITWFTGGSANTSYRPLYDYVVSWTETVSAVDYIYINRDQVGAAPNPSDATQVAVGSKSDIAGVLRNDNTRIAQLTYIDGSNDLEWEEWDMTTTSHSQNTSNTLETGRTIVDDPRIDATNVDKTSGYIKWAVIAANTGGGSGLDEVRIYDDVNGLTDLAPADPFDPIGVNENGINPSIGIGPGPDDYSGYSIFGNDNYLLGFRVSNLEVVAADYNNAGTGTWGNYYEANKTAMHANVPRPYTSFGSSSNCGIGHFASWTNFEGSGGGYMACFKANPSGSTPSFKPAKTNSIVETKQNNYNFWPNPGADFVHVDGLKTEAPYTATDITGRIVMQNTASPTRQKIDISQLSKGVYIFNFNEAGTVTQLKLVKQ